MKIIAILQKVDILNRLNEQTKTYSEENIISKWSECDNDENGKGIGEVNDDIDVQKWFERIKLKVQFEVRL